MLRITTLVRVHMRPQFQRAPTLGGECYGKMQCETLQHCSSFNGHPPLGVNATESFRCKIDERNYRFNGHPPLGVNATGLLQRVINQQVGMSFNGHPPLGVNATDAIAAFDECNYCYEFQRAPTLGGECY